MRCNKCDYVLWNLKARACPECGEPFQPSDYEFVPNGVQFCCPHCNQAYYGTTAKGHLDPTSFNCVNCAQPLQMDEMVLRPASGIAESRAAQQSLPWLASPTGGTSRIKSFFATCGWAMSAPTRIMRGVPEMGRAGAAWLFAYLVGMFCAACSYSTIALLIFFVELAQGNVDYDSLAGSLLVPPISGLSFLAMIAVWGLIAHAILKVTGPTSGGIGRTYAALCYGSGTMIAGAIPCIGIWFGFLIMIWWAISSGIMLAKGQRVSGGRAAFAVATVPTILMLSLIGLMIFGVMYTSQTMMQVGQQNAIVIQQASTTEIAAALNQYAAGNGGWPDHAARLVQDDLVDGWDFTIDWSTPASASVGSTDLALFDSITTETQNEEIEKELRLFPDNMIAYRVGDFVLTYSGIDHVNDDGALWIAVAAPQQSVGERRLIAGRLDGTAETFTGEKMIAEALAAQNDLRADHGLAPLPDPVMFDQGAIAPQQQSATEE